MVRTISIKQLYELEQAKEKNKNPQVGRKLDILIMRGNGAQIKEIAATVGYSNAYISVILSKYHKEGLEGITKICRAGNRRNMSLEEEYRILKPFLSRLEQGERVNTKEIEAAYQAAVSHPIGRGQIYDVLHRHGWSRGSLKGEFDIRK